MSNDCTVAELQIEVSAFADAREWAQFHDAKNLSMALASEVGELNALLRWVPNAHVDEALSRPEQHDAFVSELGDIGILLLLLCKRTGISLDVAVRSKLRRNALKYPEMSSRGLADPPAGAPPSR